MKILIPSHCFEITGEVQQVLLLAAKQGFDISNIELGVSPTLYIQLVETKTSLIATNLFEQTEVSHQEVDTFLLYPDQYILDSNRQCHLNEVMLGTNYDGRVVDRWHHLGVETLLVHKPSLSENALPENESWRHFAWVVASLALDFPLEDALVLTRAAMNVSRETWPTQFSSFPDIEQPSDPNTKTPFSTLDKQSLGLYPVVDSVDRVRTLLSLGVKTVQLRIKNPCEPTLEQQIIESIELGRKHNAQVFINDYWQLAIQHGAFGVHLGQEDVLEADLELIANKGIKLGLSTHGYFELLRIHQLSPSYIALGHIFPTTTKQMPSKPQGLVRLSLYQKLLASMPYGFSCGVPSVAIGGIELGNIEQVLNQGVSSVAVVRAITESNDVPSAVEQLQSKLKHKHAWKEVSDVI